MNRRAGCSPGFDGPTRARRRPLRGTVLAGLLLAAALGVAAGIGPAIGPATAAASDRITLEGDLTAGARLYPETLSPGRDVEWELGGELELSWRPHPRWRAQVGPRFWWDPLDSGRRRWVPREAWVGYRAGPLSVRAGRQVLGWGSADSYRPTDVASTRDWGRDFLDPEKMGDWSLTTTYGAGRFGVELVYLPVLEGVDFPSARSPWSIESAEERLGLIRLPLLDDPWIPAGVSEQSLAARARMTLGQTDFYLVGYTGVDRQPLLALDQVCAEPGCLGGELVLRAAYPRLRLGGLEVQAAVGAVLVKAEATYRDQTSGDPEFQDRTTGLRDHSVQVVTGIDWLWLEALGGGGDLDVVLEFLYDDAARGDDLLTWRPFQKDLAAALTYFANDLSGTVVELGWIQDLERTESLGTVRVRRRIRQRVTLEAGGDLVIGPEEPANPFALFGPNDRLVLRLVYGL